MIVRCKSCNSAFAVDDEKVSGKKFAYSCLKCGTENIVDNRIDDISPLSDAESDIRPGTKTDTFTDNSAAPAAADNDIFLDDSSFDMPEPDTSTSDKEIITDDESDFFTDDELISFDDETDTKSGKPAAQDDLIFDDFESSHMPIEDSEFDDPGSSPSGKDEPKLTRQEDIDELFATIPASKGKTPSAEDETPLDLNEIDLEFEDTPALDMDDEILVFDDDGINEKEPVHGVKSEDDIDIDLAELDIDFDESIDFDDTAESADGIAIDLDDEISGTEKRGTSPLEIEDVKFSELEELDLDIDFPEDSIDELSEKSIPNEVTSDDDLTLDLKELDIDLDESELPGNDDTASDEFDEDLKLNLDELDIDLEEEIITDSEELLLSDSAADTEEDLSLHLDELDIDLDEHIAPASGSELLSDSLSEEDVDLTLNLDELDIDIEDEVIQSSLENIKETHSFEGIDEDESITIDLETLDIEVSDNDRSADFDIFDDEEKLTIDDAGLTFDELTENKHSGRDRASMKKQIKDSLDEIDPEFELHAISDDSTAHEAHIIDTIDELPEIDLDEYEEFLTEKQADSQTSHSQGLDRFAEDINFDDIEIIPIDDDLDIYTSDDDISDNFISGRGTTTLSIDFSLKYSRLEALLRLTGLYFLTLIPQFIVLLIYTVISTILGFINQVVILFTGHCVEDFSQITENTLRSLIYIKTNITGIVEDRPVFSGRADINHQLQLNITYPLKYSRNIALLRLSIIGMIIFILPHLLILALLSLAVPAAFIAGLIIVTATGRWPGILFTFLTKYFRYLTKVTAFAIGLNDEYPPFRFE